MILGDIQKHNWAEKGREEEAGENGLKTFMDNPKMPFTFKNCNKI